jgi:hypothetical protein
MASYPRDDPISGQKDWSNPHKSHCHHIIVPEPAIAETDSVSGSDNDLQVDDPNKGVSFSDEHDHSGTMMLANATSHHGSIPASDIQKVPSMSVTKCD